MKRRILFLILGGVILSSTGITAGVIAKQVADEAAMSQISVAKLESITLDTSETKSEFILGEEFSISGLKINGNYDNDTVKKIASSKCSISSPDMTAIGEKDIVVSYKEKEASYKINVINVTPTSITLNDENVKKDYTEGDILDVSKLTVNVNYDGKTSVVKSNFTVSNVDLNSPGNDKEVIVTYNGISASFTINIAPLEPDITLSGAGTYTYEAEKFYKSDKATFVTRQDFIDAGLCAEGDCCVREDSKHSGGKAIYAFTAGTQFRLRVYCPNNVEATLNVVMGCVDGPLYSNGVMKMNVDGEEHIVIKQNIGNCPSDTDLFDIEYAELNLTKGTHDFEFNVVNWHFNLDCFKFIIGGGDEEIKKQAHIIINNGETKTYEAENFTNENCVIVTRQDFIDASICAPGEFHINTDPSFSGGQSICAFRDGSVFTIKVFAENDMTIKCYARLGTTDGPLALNTVAGLKVDGTDIALSNEAIGQRTSSTDLIKVLLCEKQITKGLHTFEFTDKYWYFDLDCFTFEASGNVPIVDPGDKEILIEAETLTPENTTGYVLSNDNASDGKYLQVNGGEFIVPFNLKVSGNINVHFCACHNDGSNYYTYHHFTCSLDDVSQDQTWVSLATQGNEFSFVDFVGASLANASIGNHTLIFKFNYTVQFDYIKIVVE